MPHWANRQLTTANLSVLLSTQEIIPSLECCKEYWEIVLVYRGSPIYPYKLICCYFLHFDHLELHSVVFLLTGTLAPLHSLSKFYISSRSHVHVFRLVSLHNLPHPLLSALPQSVLSLFQNWWLPSAWIPLLTSSHFPTKQFILSLVSILYF